MRNGQEKRKKYGGKKSEEEVHKIVKEWIEVRLKKVKAKLFLRLIKHHAAKTYGEWRYSSIILDFGIGWRWVVSLTTTSL
jgi:hypothetical protein